MPIPSQYVCNKTSLPNTHVTSQEKIMERLEEPHDKGALGNIESSDIAEKQHPQNINNMGI